MLLAFVLALAAPAAAAPVAPRTVLVPRHASLVMTGAQADDHAGASVAGAGDVNGDGRADVIVGAPLADPDGRIDAGAAYVVFGANRRDRLSLGALGKRGFRITGAVARPSARGDVVGLPRGAGGVVRGAGDVNGDGLDDLLVSARVASPVPGRQPHAVFVVFGKRDAAPVDLQALGAGGFAIESDDNFVTVFTGEPAGDVNGDGLADVAVTLDVSGDEDAGAAAVVFGKVNPAPVSLSDFLTPPKWGLWLRFAGGALAAAGDVNRDGLGDLLVGNANAGSGTRCCDGAVYVAYGRRSPGTIRLGPHPNPSAALAIAAPVPGAGFGASVARLGRGFVAGAPGPPYGSPTGSGAVFVKRTPSAPTIRLYGARRGATLGYELSAPGDIDRDGRADVLTVEYSRPGRAPLALLFSSDGRLIATYRGLRNSYHMRARATGAGDTNGDRRPDLLFGSPDANAAYLITAR